MRSLLALSRILDGIVTGIGKAAAFLFIPMMLIIIYDVTQRKLIEVDNRFIDTVFYFSSTKLQELEWHLHGILFLLCLGFAYARDAHVRIELLRERMQPRTRVWLELLGCLLFLIPYSWLVVRYGWGFAERAWAMGETSAAQTGLAHRWIIKGMLPLGFGLLALAGVSVALKCMLYLFGPPELQPRVAHYAGTQGAIGPSDETKPRPG